MSPTSSLPKNNHENLDVKSDDNGRPVKLLVRQERICPDPGTCLLHIKDVKYSVVNYSAFGLAFESGEFLERGQEFNEAVFSYDNFEIGKYHLKVVRQAELADNKIMVGVEVLGEPIDIAKIEGIRIGLELARSTSDEITRWSNVPDTFRARVNEIRDVLESLRAECDRAESQLNWETSEVYRLRESAGAVVGRILSTNFGSLMKKLGTELSSAPVEARADYFAYFRSKLQSLIYRSPLANRAYQKPLGYAGDFQMMNIMYDKQPIGDSLFAKCIHQYFIEAPASQAVRNRAEYLKKKIAQTLEETSKKGKVARIISVASGPAREIALVFNDIPAATELPVEFHLLDQDVSALQDAQRRLVGLKKRLKARFEIKLHNLAIKNVIARGLPESDFDLVYSAGLFDYFSDSVAGIAAQRLSKACSPSGKLIIGNFNTENPSQIIMELALDWHLIYRSEDQLRKLFENTGGTLTIEREPENINLFCEIRKS